MAKGRNHTEFLLLLALLDGPKHGYEIAKYIEEKSYGFFKVPFSTLYPLLHSLEKFGAVTMTAEEDCPRPRKIYALTPSGRRQAKAEVSTFQEFSRATMRLAQS